MKMVRIFLICFIVSLIVSCGGSSGRSSSVNKQPTEAGTTAINVYDTKTFEGTSQVTKLYLDCNGGVALDTGDFDEFSYYIEYDGAYAYYNSYVSYDGNVIANKAYSKYVGKLNLNSAYYHIIDDYTFIKTLSLQYTVILL
ncbi:hypothetical protein Dacet_2430 [Denitrovibrio acetiphilus DSM 12809]|uniref:Lipoprotein n=1 Tax=Denitrovibrio acetiphilus (strain DSM 12809 / NBRC 114555 / N2460) TaxID=522772 RepID=D4H3T9_DENA2|nr:hypothetical protein [Denitrovibrio acetiphilus]ADD69191.1 hypothetical protein Dacet_2430 [Denitrovibrio acetiphilus DSM 12809]